MGCRKYTRSDDGGPLAEKRKKWRTWELNNLSRSSTDLRSSSERVGHINEEENRPVTNDTLPTASSNSLSQTGVNAQPFCDFSELVISCPQKRGWG
jgi:hypothetical protein